MSNPENSMLYQKPALKFHRELKQITFSVAQDSTPAASSDQRHATAEATSQTNATAEETADWIQRGVRPGGTHDRKQYGYSGRNADGVYRMEGGRMVYYDRNNMPRD